MADKPKVHYFEMGPWPVYVGFTQSPKAFAREMKRLNVTDPPAFVASDHANATKHSFMSEEDGMTCIITMPPSDKSPAQIAALIAHEAVHVAQEIWEWLGEKEPGREAEAYLVQHVVQCCLLQIKAAAKPRNKAQATAAPATP